METNLSEDQEDLLEELPDEAVNYLRLWEAWHQSAYADPFAGPDSFVAELKREAFELLMARVDDY
jgi:hypothetical protein